MRKTKQSISQNELMKVICLRIVDNVQHITLRWCKYEGLLMRYDISKRCDVIRNRSLNKEADIIRYV